MVDEALGVERVEAVRPTGEALGRVVQTFVPTADAVIDAEFGYADGGQETLTGTPNHPFWVPAVNDYVALEDVKVGTVLRTCGGSDATVLGLTFRKGDVEVYDIEVEGLHNVFVRGAGSDAPGVLVHNSTATSAAGDAVEEGQTVYRVWGGESGSGGRYGSRTDPSAVDNDRDEAGLPNEHTGQFVSEGRLVDTTGVEVTPGGAAPLHGNAGGIDEIKIPNISRFAPGFCPS